VENNEGFSEKRDSAAFDQTRDQLNEYYCALFHAFAKCELSVGILDFHK
jgi:hypothetical protein